MINRPSTIESSLSVDSSVGAIQLDIRGMLGNTIRGAVDLTLDGVEFVAVETGKITGRMANVTIKTGIEALKHLFGGGK